MIQLQLGTRFASDKERRAKENGADKRTDRDVRPGRKRRSTPPTAANNTETFAMRSFREQSQTDRMLMSSARWRQSTAKQTPFAASARAPTPPIVSTVRELREKQLVHDLSKDEQTKEPHHRRLRDRSPRFPDRAARDDVETEAIDQRVAEHVEGVSEQSHGPSEQARHEFDDKHRSVHEQNEAKSRRLPLAQPVDGAALIDTAIVHILETNYQ